MGLMKELKTLFDPAKLDEAIEFLDKVIHNAGEVAAKAAEIREALEWFREQMD